MATSKSTLVDKEVFTVQTVREVTLTLSEAETVILAKILANVAGPPSGPRGIADGILSALWEELPNGAQGVRDYFKREDWITNGTLTLQKVETDDTYLTWTD